MAQETNEELLQKLLNEQLSLKQRIDSLRKESSIINDKKTKPSQQNNKQKSIIINENDEEKTKSLQQNRPSKAHKKDPHEIYGYTHSEMHKEKEFEIFKNLTLKQQDEELLSLIESKFKAEHLEGRVKELESYLQEMKQINYDLRYKHAIQLQNLRKSVQGQFTALKKDTFEGIAEFIELNSKDEYFRLSYSQRAKLSTYYVAKQHRHLQNMTFKSNKDKEMFNKLRLARNYLCHNDRSGHSSDGYTDWETLKKLMRFFPQEINHENYDL